MGLGILIQKQQSCFKKACSSQEGHCEEIQAGGQEMGRLYQKLLITTILMKCRIPVKCGEGSINLLELSLLKFLLLTYHCSHFLAATLDSTSFFIVAFWGATHFFYSFAVFGLDFTSFCMLQSWHIAINGCYYLSSFFLFVGRYFQCSTCVSCIRFI